MLSFPQDFKFNVLCFYFHFDQSDLPEEEIPFPNLPVEIPSCPLTSLSLPFLSHPILYVQSSVTSLLLKKCKMNLLFPPQLPYFNTFFPQWHLSFQYFPSFNIGFPGQMSSVFHQSLPQAVQMSISCRNVKLGTVNQMSTRYIKCYIGNTKFQWGNQVLLSDFKYK